MSTIFVGMSGGVDSSVTAAVLKEHGYSVTGVYMKNWTQDILGFECPWRQDLTDAQSVAAELDIPLKIYDFETQYRQEVVDYMVEGYRVGHTPNPDVMCNQEIKFKLFLQTALDDGADMIATGHYARIQDLQGPALQKGLYQGVDVNKDQSYFLYRVTEEALQRSLMPLGGLTKPEVRELARKFGLPVAEKKDSVGVCFVGEVGIKEFLSQYIELEPGPIKRLDGTVLGEHDGAAFYTIGQRHGLNVGGGLPLYVADKDVATNTVFVTENLEHLQSDSFSITELHWINEAPDSGQTYQVRTRYRGDLVECRVKQIDQTHARVDLSRSERAITPGQSAVFYDGERVVGGGIITG